MGFGSGMIFASAQNAATSGVKSHQAGVAAAMVNTTQQIGGSIGIATFSSLAATAVTNYLQANASTATHTATIANATLAGYHLVFWIAAAVFLADPTLAALLFRSGPLPVNPDAETNTIH
jgi:MFS family permease